jgi:hypothetical protein
MGESEHRTFWAAIGVGFLASGLVALSTFYYASLTAPPKRDLAASPWPWLVGCSLFALGILILLAVAMPRWWLPGRPDVAFRLKQREIATDALAVFHGLCSRYKDIRSTPATWNEVNTLRNGLTGFADAAYGPHEALAIAQGFNISVSNENAVDGAAILLERIVRLVERSDIIKVRSGFVRDNGWAKSEWVGYVNGVARGTFNITEPVPANPIETVRPLPLGYRLRHRMAQS